jgi:glycosyltransferase involved in cell wall biosynthesis
MNKQEPVLSVCVCAYQHAPFVARCIESILAQQTDFPFEIIIGEDESADGTREICKQFAAQYPDRIRLLLHARKDVHYVNGKATGRSNFMRTVSAAKGKYIAICEGDDYWTDVTKLQQQVDFLAQHPEYSMVCSHAVKVDDNGDEKDKLPLPGKTTFTIRDLARYNFIITASVVFRTANVHSAIRRPDFLATVAGDYFIEMMSAVQGPVHYHHNVFVAWRIHAGSVWGNKPQSIQLLNGLFAQYLMIRNLPAGHEARAILQAVVKESIEQLFRLSDFNFQKAMQRLHDVPFRKMMIGEYSRFTGKPVRYEPASTDTTKLKLLRLLGMRV